MELVRFPSHGRFSVRSIFVFALAALITALLSILISSTPANAAGSANWSGDSIIYDNHSYGKVTDFKDTTNTIPDGSTVYQTPAQAAANNGSDKVFVLYFTPGVDPPTATTVKYVEFDLAADKSVSNPQNAQDVTLTLKGTESEQASCSVQGIGWIICPVSVFVAEGMDNVFDLLSSMIAVQPSTLGDPNDSIFVAWNVARNIANIAFVIAFLIIIYSQITSVGISNYGLKKMIPRLIIAAVLVNISFIISAAAIDISNILGYSIQNAFNSIRENIFHLTNDNLSGFNTSPWSTVTSIILAGGGAVGGIYYAATGGLWLLIPLLLGLISVLILVVIVLAARQAIIVVLVIIAPLAFVAYLLPNTEKWFDRWKDIFMTMLIFFPAFSLVFGGSQLAGQIIIQNAGDNVVVLLFGLAVQIAPLVITPLLLKLSGSLLGRIAQIANNPSKGLLDRNKKWAESRAELTRNNAIGKNLDGRNKLNPLLMGSRMAKSSEFRRRNLQGKIDNAKQNADNRYHESKKYHAIHEKAADIDFDKQTIETSNKKHIQDRINIQGTDLHLKNAQLEAGKRALETTVKVTEADTKQYESGRVPVGASPELASAVRRMSASRQDTAIETMRSSAADSQIQREFAEALKVSAQLRSRAGGIKPLGSSSVLASAVSAVRKADAEDIKNIQDASDLKPGNLNGRDGAAERMATAIRAGNSIEARAYQNMLVTAGGAGMEAFRKEMISLGTSVPTDISEDMRDNLLANHGALKAKSNDLIEWAAKGGLLETATTNPVMWAGLSDKDFIGQHPKSQAYALNANSFTRERAQRILAADVIEGNVLTEDVKQRLRNIT